jgi:arabinose-5-phosphate isomerase
VSAIIDHIDGSQVSLPATSLDTRAAPPIEATQRATLVHTVRTEAEGLLALESALAGALGDSTLEAVACIAACVGRVIVTGMGKSGHVGRKIAATLASTGTPALFVHPAEASHGDLGMITPSDVILAISWSGEAPELANVIAYARRFKVHLIAMTSQHASTLGTAADNALILPKVREACPNGLAPTTSTTLQLALGDAIAMALLEARGFSAADFRNFHPGGKLGARLKRARDLMHGSSELPLVSEQATLADAIIEMTSRHFGVAGILDSAGDLVGVVTDGDLRRAFQNGFQDRPVVDVMTRQPKRAAPEQMADDLLRLMSELRISSLFIEEAGKPVGIVHLHDLLRAGVQ